MRPRKLSLIRWVRDELGSAPSSSYAFQNTRGQSGLLEYIELNSSLLAAWNACSHVFRAYTDAFCRTQSSMAPKSSASPDNNSAFRRMNTKLFSGASARYIALGNRIRTSSGLSLVKMKTGTK